MSLAILLRSWFRKSSILMTHQAITDDDPPWIKKALEHLGTKEIPGPEHNQEIVDWWELLKLPFRDDETPWCASFMNSMVLAGGCDIPTKYRAAALGWRWTGHGIELSEPIFGAIFICVRKGRPGSGHTGFVVGRDDAGRVMILGGNQANEVSIRPYDPQARDARYYWPSDYHLPDRPINRFSALPLIDGDGKMLENEQ